MFNKPSTKNYNSPKKRVWSILLYGLTGFVLLLAWLGILGSLFIEDFGQLIRRSSVDAAMVQSLHSEPIVSMEAAVVQEEEETPTPTPTETPTPPPAIPAYTLPTPEPGGRILRVSPSQGNVGWWASDGTRSTGVDSFLYAGQSDGKTFVSVIRFDLRQVPPQTQINEVTLRLTGLRTDHLQPSAGGKWSIDLLAVGIIDDLMRADFSSIYTAPTAVNLLSLDASELNVGQENYLTFNTIVRQWFAQQIARGYSSILVRISSSGQSGNSLFAWDSGLGMTSLKNSPELVLSLGADAVTPIPPFLVTPTPAPENVLTAAVMIMTATAVVEQIGTSTPLPHHYVIATPTATPWVVTVTPLPENAATASAETFYATAVALTTGTFTPMPPNMVIATNTPLATATPTTPLISSLADMTPTPTPTATRPPPDVLPAQLRGQILFLSDRNDGRTQVFALNPNTGELSMLNERWPYDLAKSKETLSPNGQFTAIVQEDHARVPQVKLLDHQYNVIVDLTRTNGWSFDPAWSPQGDRIVFVSQEPGNDEIYTIAPDGTDMQRLTHNGWEWDKHPSWSPDGSQIVFWSNRETGRNQLWIMDRDGGSQRRLHDSPANDWDPVWVK
jgi:hypothetical protein